MSVKVIVDWTLDGALNISHILQTPNVQENMLNPCTKSQPPCTYIRSKVLYVICFLIIDKHSISIVVILYGLLCYHNISQRG